LGRKVNLGRIGQILDENIDSEVMVLHVSQATQRPRPWVEVERVKAAPVEKPHDVGIGRQTKGAHSGEREPGPVQNFDFDSSQGSLHQTPVSRASPKSNLPIPLTPPAQRKKKRKKSTAARFTKENWVNVGNLIFDVPKNPEVASLSDQEVFEEGPLWRGLTKEQTKYQVKPYETWFGTELDKAKRPCGLIYNAKSGRVFLSDGKRKPNSNGFMATVVGFHTLGLAGAAVAELFNEGMKKRKARARHLNHPSSVVIPFNDIVMARVVKEKRRLKDVVTLIVERELASGAKIEYYETSVHGAMDVPIVLELAKARLAYEARIYTHNQITGDELLNRLGHFKQCDFLSHYISSESALMSLIENPVALSPDDLAKLGCSFACETSSL